MRELSLTDNELQDLIAGALKTRLARAGFSFGAPEIESHDILMFPINLDLAGHVVVSRSEDGMWLFRQTDSAIQQRFNDSHAAFAEAIHRRSN